MKASIFLVVIGLACVFGYPVEDEQPEWAMVPTADGHFKMINVKEEEFLASLQEKADFPVTFYLYTRSNPSSGQIINTGDVNSLKNSYFSASRQTRFVIHGWRNDYTSDVNNIVRNAYLTRGDFNVIVVDWKKGAESITYLIAKNNVGEAGKKVAAFIDFLVANGNSASNMYVIGHSLGAHVSGFSGKNAKSKINTIYGLDPALPLFSDGDTGGRLAKGDASYVQSIHTDSGRLGFDTPIGDASFYPNFLKTQPGCGTDLTGSCSHSRSYQYLAESITANKFLGLNCGSFANIKSSVCPGPATALMGGEPSNRSILGIFYVPVNSAYPFATGRV